MRRFLFSAALIFAVVLGNSVVASAAPLAMSGLIGANAGTTPDEKVGWRRQYRRYGYPVPYAYYPPGYGYHAPPAYAYPPPAYGYYPPPLANGDYPTADDNYPPQGDDYPAAKGDYEGYPPESGGYPSTKAITADIQAKMAANPNCPRLRLSGPPGVQSVSPENPRNLRLGVDLPFFDPNSQSWFTSKETQKNQEGSILGVELDLSETASAYQICFFSHAGGQAWAGRSRDAATG